MDWKLKILRCDAKLQQKSNVCFKLVQVSSTKTFCDWDAFAVGGGENRVRMLNKNEVSTCSANHSVALRIGV